MNAVSGNAKRQFLLGITLAGITLAVYAQVARFDFVNFDDDAHVYENPHVTGGLTGENLFWAFKIHGPSQWHPLAWISHQVDCELFGLWPGGHHLTSLVLHAANAILLFLLLSRWTGSTWQSAFVAAVFAVHPLNVESVAWVSERRNVLSLFFCLLTLGAYGVYVRNRTPPLYLLVAVLYAFALMSKPLAVTLPCVMLLLDYWPFRRIGFRNGSDDENKQSQPSLVSPLYLLLEKVPLFLFAAGASLLTIWCQEGIIADAETLPFEIRFVNALAAYAIYLRQFVWPSDLAAFYPHPGFVSGDPLAELLQPAIVGGVILLAATAWAIARLRARPYLVVGWLWFLGTMVPMLGLIQSGQQQLADRYMYLPAIGLLMATTWLIGEWARSWKLHWSWAALFGGGAVAAFAVASWIQTGYWKNSIALFERTLEVTENNSLAHNNLGLAYSQDHRPARAIAHFVEAIRIDPEYGLARYNLGVVLHDQGQVDQAIYQYQEALKQIPAHVETQMRMGIAWADLGDPRAGIPYFQEAIRLAPDRADGHLNLAIAYVSLKDHALAIASFRRALAIDPKNTKAHFGLALELVKAGDFGLAEKHFLETIENAPEFALARVELGKLYLKQGHKQKANEQFRKAIAIQPDSSEARKLLGASSPN